jgi:VRR-NUC domain.
MTLYKANEAAEQIAVMDWAAYMTGRMPELELLYHVPNGGKRNITEAVQFKAMGVKPGVPDLVLPVPRGGFHGLYIELKAKGGSTSSVQREWVERLNCHGYCARVCVGADEAIKVIMRYLAA